MGTRHHIYTSLDDLVGDAKVVVTGTAGAVGLHKVDGSIFTATTVEVAEQFFPEGLGTKPVDTPTETYEPPEVLGHAITVRQVGDPGTGPGPALETGREYLLFLVPTGLAEDSETTFYVAGAVAGMYVRDGEAYKRLSDEDPELPETLTTQALR